MRYLKWNYDTGKLTEYFRTGECNGCGACCRALIRYDVADSYPSTTGSTVGRTIGEEKGIWLECNDGDRRYFIRDREMVFGKQTCGSFEGGKCLQHFMKSAEDNYLMLCDIWPMGPSHVVPFPDCSYQFQRIAEWDIDKLGEEC